MNKIIVLGVVVALTAIMAPKCHGQQSTLEVENAVSAAQAAPAQEQEESYQRVYEAFTRLMQNVSNNSMGSFRRLMSRLNQLVGSPSQPQLPPSLVSASKDRPTSSFKCEQGIEDDTDQILTRLDKVNKNTDQNTLNQLNDDVSKLVSTLNNSYLRNIRRVIERVNKVVGQSSATSQPLAINLHQQGDRLNDNAPHRPGIPGWDEALAALDRWQKSMADFIRSSTRLVTAG